MEVVNGQFKRDFKLFLDIMQDFPIDAALLNKLAKRLRDHDNAQQFLI